MRLADDEAELILSACSRTGGETFNFDQRADTLMGQQSGNALASIQAARTENRQELWSSDTTVRWNKSRNVIISP